MILVVTVLGRTQHAYSISQWIPCESQCLVYALGRVWLLASRKQNEELLAPVRLMWGHWRLATSTRDQFPSGFFFGFVLFFGASNRPSLQVRPDVPPHPVSISVTAVAFGPVSKHETLQDGDWLRFLTLNPLIYLVCWRRRPWRVSIM